jgi:polyhydroxybutyrate depolymerase
MNLTPFVSVALLLGPLACGSEAEPPPAADEAAPPAVVGTPTTSDDPTPGETPAPAPAPARCAGKEALSGDLEWTVTAGGQERRVRVHLPGTYAPDRALPVVLSFHGYTSTAREQDALARMSRKADEAGFIAVHPEGTGGQQSWNGGACCGDATKNDVDDVAFVSALLDELETRLCVDDRRVFATGMSNGGFLSHRLACEMSERIAAIAPVAGVIGVSSCAPKRPMSVMQFHGTLDTLVPYNGSLTSGFPSVNATVDGWAKRSACVGSPREIVRQRDVVCTRYETCAGGAEVALCTVTGGGHTWPGGTPVPILGYTTTSIRATDAMWEFFQRHPLPE